MDELLIPVSRTYKSSPARGDDFLTLSQPQLKATATPIEAKFAAQSPEEALEALKSQPSYDKLVAVLKYLRHGVEGKHGFNIQQPGSQSAQIVHILVSEIVPNYWAIISEDTTTTNNTTLHTLLIVLRSVTGANSILVYMKALLKQAQSNPKGLQDVHVATNLKSSLELLAALLESDGTIKYLWSSVSSLASVAQSRVLRQELLGLSTNNKITSTCAEAGYLLRQAEKIENETWVSSTKSYIDWLLRNIVVCLSNTADQDTETFCADLLKRAMRLTHAGKLEQHFHSVLQI